MKLCAFGDVSYIRPEGDCYYRLFELGHGSDLTRRIFLTQQVWLQGGTSSADSIKAESQLGLHFSCFHLALGCGAEIGGWFDETAGLVILTARR